MLRSSALEERDRPLIRPDILLSDFLLESPCQVWAPILGSALTTVVVFIPVLLLELPIGQLFRDIGIAICVSVLISVLISVTLIPSMAAISLEAIIKITNKSLIRMNPFLFLVIEIISLYKIVLITYVIATWLVGFGIINTKNRY